MSEKRYTFKCNENNCSIFENGVWLKIEEVVDTLNEQQATIQQLRERNKELKEILKKCAKNWKQEIIKRGHLEEEVSLL